MLRPQAPERALAHVCPHTLFWVAGQMQLLLSHLHGLLGNKAAADHPLSWVPFCSSPAPALNVPWGSKSKKFKWCQGKTRIDCCCYSIRYCPVSHGDAWEAVGVAAAAEAAGALPHYSSGIKENSPDFCSASEQMAGRQQCLHMPRVRVLQHWGSHAGLVLGLLILDIKSIALGHLSKASSSLRR